MPKYIFQNYYIKEMEESQMAKHIILQTKRSKRAGGLKGVVRINAEAEEILLGLAAETGLPLCEVASQMITQGAEFVKIVDADE